MKVLEDDYERLWEADPAFLGSSGFLSATETWLASQGVLAIAGFAPTTQGKDERSHRTLTQFLDARHPVSLAEVNTYLAEYRQVYNERRRHQSLLIGKMHITPRQAFDTFPKAPSPQHPLDPEQVWERVVAYNQAHTPQAVSEMLNGPAEAATSHEANTDDRAALQGIPPTDTPTLTMPATQSTNHWGIPDQLCVGKDGVVRVCSFSLYIGLRFKNADSTPQSQPITLRSSTRPMTVNSSSACHCRSH
ncbi:integrase core domain-containing protein [Corynebacterium guaraldiae]